MEKVTVRAGAEIRTRRTLRGWKLRELADAAGMDLSQLSKVERGRRGTTLEQYGKIARVLECPLSSLFAEQASQPPPTSSRRVPVIGHKGKPQNGRRNIRAVDPG